jgi:hypothetical protein
MYVAQIQPGHKLREPFLYQKEKLTHFIHPEDHPWTMPEERISWKDSNLALSESA